MGHSASWHLMYPPPLHRNQERFWLGGINEALQPNHLLKAWLTSKLDHRIQKVLHSHTLIFPKYRELTFSQDSSFNIKIQQKITERPFCLWASTCLLTWVFEKENISRNISYSPLPVDSTSPLKNLLLIMAKLDIFHAQILRFFPMASASLSHFLEKISLNQLTLLWTCLRSRDQWLPWKLPPRSPQDAQDYLSNWKLPNSCSPCEDS